MKKRLASVVACLLAFSMVFTSCGSERKSDVSRRERSSLRIDDEELDEYVETEEYIADDLAADVSPRNGLNRVEAQGNDSAYTIMFYFIGSNLEADGGMATNDIDEILDADLGDDVNVLLEVGGTTRWRNRIMDANSVQRYKVQDGELVLLEDLGMCNMCDKATLTDYLKWGAEEYPADRYAAILWDHGGGTMAGFGVDDNYPDDNGLSIKELGDAFGATGNYFDFIGFDACLMATVETAYALKNSANYMIASEEEEAGLGWYYTDWLTELGKDPYMPIESIGRNVIDGFLNENGNYDRDAGTYGTDDRIVSTLSLIDLAQIEGTMDALKSFMDKSMNYLDSSQFRSYAQARVNAREYGEGEFEQIDILDYINLAAVPGTYDIQNAIRSCIIYNNSNISGSNGLAMYYPYYYPGYYSTMKKMLVSLGIQQDYFDFFDTFCSVITYAQETSVAESNIASNEVNEGLTEEEWYSEEVAEEYYEDNIFASGEELIYEEYNNQWVIKFDEDDWASIANITIYVLSDIGEKDGYMELGTDNIYNLTNEDYLIGTFDNYWISMNGNIVPQYFMRDGNYEDGSYYSWSYIPAEMNGRDIRILLYYYKGVNQRATNTVCGYIFEDENTELADRNYHEFVEGDQFRFYAQYYTDNFDDDGYYYIYKPVTVGADGLGVEYIQMNGDSDTYFYYKITDVYQNVVTTEWLHY